MVLGGWPRLKREIRRRCMPDRNVSGILRATSTRTGPTEPMNRHEKEPVLPLVCSKH
jgi:hypothetical protein